MPQRSQPGESESAPAYHLEVHVRPARGSHAWDASLQGTTPEGRPIDRREFASLMDLMRFLEALVTERGLR
ncbi:hypothetical protein DAETH_37740 (plasmid) [Deinococcus aetherius]|uniref:Uncharacterized protein n=1 Tax=Deinococcus aetherius TaxID=200252 RepID=A0ABM8AJ14_9DEIO|nr:hypothetical protein [Deinococcus aetherius]BDP43805.1 hypothetical protein DAETH_37740 [Deinococcus aetherius]